MAEPDEQKPIRVKMKVGNVEFEIEGTVDQANNAVGKFLTTVTEKLKEIPLISEREGAPPRVKHAKSLFNECGKKAGSQHPMGWARFTVKWLDKVFTMTVQQWLTLS